LEDLEQAFQAICQSVRINPLAAIGYYTLGLIWEKMGHDLGAVAAYEKSLTLDQDHLKSCNNLGSIYYRLGQFDQALILYKKMIEIQPDFYGSYLNVGNIMIQEQQYEQAISYYQKALKRKPQDCNILYNLGLAYQANGDQKVALKNFALSTYYQQDYEATVNFCNHYLALAQDEPLIYIYLGKSYELLGYYTEAIETFEQGIQKHPKEEALYYLGGLFFQNFAINTKLKELKDQVTHLFPNSVTIELQFLGLLPLVYDSEAELSTYRKNIVAALDRIETLFDSQRPIEQIHAIFLNINSFYIFYQGQCDREIQERLGWIFHQTMTTLYPQWSQPLKVPPLTAQGKIKVGYISSCMCNHVVGLMTLGWLKHHDKNQFDLYSYYVGKQLDSVTQKFQLYSHSFYQIDELERLCEQILQDQVHILVFLDMGMVPFMMQMGCLRLAPIQCKFWGPPVTSGLPTIDYFLSSDLMEPEQGLEHYSETLVRLPQIAVSYPKPSTIDLTKTRADFGIGETRIAYFCCQVPQKYLPQYDSIFLEIAQKVPDAQFVFIERKNPHVMQHLLDRIGRIFAQVHLSFQDYFVLIPPVSALEFLNVNLLCDVTLDTFEWSGGKTGLDSLACGVPVVTCPGQLMRGRHSYGILQMLGVIDTIARSEAEYIDIAVRLGLNKQWRQDIAQKIQNHHDRLFDDMDCIQGLEAFYIQVVQESLQEFSP
jgi:predicted O-linked N-acetylglucosamine transferase (SPINDLY family)